MSCRPVQSAKAFLNREDGTATIEFLFTFPIIMVLFLATIESSFFMIRQVMLERAVDLTVRELRLGLLPEISHADLKETICQRGVVLGSLANCKNTLKIGLETVDTVAFEMPTDNGVADRCVDRNVPIDPLVAEPAPSADEYSLGGDNELMLMRVCLKAEPMFATTVFGARLSRVDTDGSYGVTTTSIFVNEPAS
ncbi:MAG: pilus assembly protein [Tabrizicola sp.]|nr:pilus assembly protein [Tabrizicola sp.]